MSELQTFRSLAPSLKAGAAGTHFLQHERRFFTRHRCLRPLLCPRPGLWPPSRLRPPAPTSLAGWEALAWTQLQNRREGREGKHLCSLLTRKPPDEALPRTGAPTRATGPPRWSSECECVIGHSQTSLGTPVTPPRDGRRSRPVSVQSQQSRGDPAPDGVRCGRGPRPVPPPPSLSPGPLVWSHLSKHSGSYAVVLCEVWVSEGCWEQRPCRGHGAAARASNERTKPASEDPTGRAPGTCPPSPGLPPLRPDRGQAGAALPELLGAPCFPPKATRTVTVCPRCAQNLGPGRTTAPEASQPCPTASRRGLSSKQRPPPQLAPT